MSKLSMHNAARRRDRAAARFNILSLDAWKHRDRVTEGSYDDYLARKQIEAKSLGIKT